MYGPLGGSQVQKRAKIDQEIAFHVRNEAEAFLKPPSHSFWHDYNLSKHLPLEFFTLRGEGVLMN